MNQYDNTSTENLEKLNTDTDNALQKEDARHWVITKRAMTFIAALFILGIVLAFIPATKILGFLFIVVSLALAYKAADTHNQKSSYYWKLVQQKKDIMEQLKYRRDKNG